MRKTRRIRYSRASKIWAWVNPPLPVAISCGFMEIVKKSMASLSGAVQHVGHSFSFPVTMTNIRPKFQARKSISSGMVISRVTPSSGSICLPFITLSTQMNQSGKPLCSSGSMETRETGTERSSGPACCATRSTVASQEWFSRHVRYGNICGGNTTSRTRRWKRGGRKNNSTGAIISPITKWRSRPRGRYTYR
jgi:hypothetical protein